MAAVRAITAATPHTFTLDKDAQPRPVWRRTPGDACIRGAATLGVYIWACLRVPDGAPMMRLVLLVVVVAVFVSGGSVAAQSPDVRSPAVELSEWDTATLLRLRDLLEAEIARRGASGDLAALRDRLQPGATPPRAGGAPAVPDASVGLGRSRSALRTWAASGSRSAASRSSGSGATACGSTTRVSGRLHGGAARRPRGSVSQPSGFCSRPSGLMFRSRHQRTSDRDAPVSGAWSGGERRGRGRVRAGDRGRWSVDGRDSLAVLGAGPRPPRSARGGRSRVWVRRRLHVRRPTAVSPGDGGRHGPSAD